VFIAFFTILIVTVVLLFISKGKYEELLSNVDKKLFPLKEFMPISLFILDSIKWGFNTRYDNLIEVKLGELYESPNARRFLKLYWANKIALVIVVLLIGLFLGYLWNQLILVLPFF